MKPKCQSRTRTKVYSDGSTVKSEPVYQKCGRDCLPGMTVCAEHADKDALIAGYQALYSENERLKGAR